MEPEAESRDPDSGIWLAAVVVTADEEAIKVKWVNYRGRTSYVHADEIREPVLRRLVRISLTRWPSLKLDFLQTGDPVQHLNVDGTRGEILSIETNDPFSAVVLTNEHPGRVFRYEHLAEPEETEEAEEVEEDAEAAPQVVDSDEEESLPDVGTPQSVADAATRQATPRRRRPRTTTHVKKKVATLLDFGEATVFQEELQLGDLRPLDEEAALAAVGNLNDQIAALEKAPTFQIPHQMGEGFLLQQNAHLVGRNQELARENGNLQTRVAELESRVTVIEGMLSQSAAHPSQHASPTSQHAPPASQSAPSTSQHAPPASQNTPSTSQHAPLANQNAPSTSQHTPPTSQHAVRRSPLLAIQAGNPSRVAVELSRELFTTEERMNGCVNGKEGARLDAGKVAVLRTRLFDACPVPRSQQAAAWRAAVKAIDGHTRYLRLKDRRDKENRQ